MENLQNAAGRGLPDGLGKEALHQGGPGPRIRQDRRPHRRHARGRDRDHRHHHGQEDGKGPLIGRSGPAQPRKPHYTRGKEAARLPSPFFYPPPSKSVSDRPDPDLRLTFFSLVHAARPVAFEVQGDVSVAEPFQAGRRSSRPPPSTGARANSPGSISIRAIGPMVADPDLSEAEPPQEVLGRPDLPQALRLDPGVDRGIGKRGRPGRACPRSAGPGGGTSPGSRPWSGRLPGGGNGSRAPGRPSTRAGNPGGRRGSSRRGRTEIPSARAIGGERSEELLLAVVTAFRGIRREIRVVELARFE